MPKNKSWFRMSKKEDKAEIEIFDEIGGFFGITLSDFKAEYDKIKDAKNIHVLINSIGGDVFVGMAMYNILSKERDKTDIETIGVSASIASIVALAGRSHTIGKGSFFMIHNPISFMAGGADDFRKRAELLDTMHDQFVSIYASKSNIGEKEIGDMMNAETWLTAEDAIKKGFADTIGDEVKLAACASPELIAKYGFTHVPDAITANGNNDQITTARELENFLRDAGGMSKSEAVAIVANGWKAIDRGEPESMEPGEPVKVSAITPAMLIEEIEAQEKLGLVPNKENK